MRVLLTAFEPYAEWMENSSWLTLVELVRLRPLSVDLITRRYPVDFSGVQACLDRDLAQRFDAVVHLGQAPGSATVKLETFALNVGTSTTHSDQELETLVPGGPAAYRSQMPLDRWNEQLRQAAIPSNVSYHAGTYLCNAVMYLSHHWHATRNLDVPVGFIHLPLASEQVSSLGLTSSSLPLKVLARAVSIILEDLQTPRNQDDNLISESIV